MYKDFVRYKSIASLSAQLLVWLGFVDIAFWKCKLQRGSPFTINGLTGHDVHDSLKIVSLVDEDRSRSRIRSEETGQNEV